MVVDFDELTEITFNADNHSKWINIKREEQTVAHFI